MANSPLPFDLETRYRRLLDALTGPVSGRWALRHVDRFLEQLGPETPKAESYLLSLAEPLAEQAADLDPVGALPERLTGLADRLRTARNARPVLQKCEALRQAEQHLRRRAGLLYGYAGAIPRVLKCLHIPGASEVKIGDTAGTPQARLRKALKCAEKGPLKPEIEWMLDRWDRTVDGGTCVPVVERLPSWARTGHEDDLHVGALRQLTVQLYGPAEAEDQIRADVANQGAEDPSLTDGPVAAARRLLADRFSRLKDQHVKGRVAFNRVELSHGGRSAGLAISALFYGAVLRHARCRIRVHVRPEVLLTGGVATDGTVRPVSEGGLPVKVRTAFFSPKARLAVPDVQLDAAQLTRDALLEEFPHGRLDLVGVERLDGLFYDRRLTKQRRIGWVRHASRRLWGRRKEVAAGALVLGLLVVIGALLYGPFDRDPALARFQGSTMLVENKSGRTLEEIEVGRGLVRRVDEGKAESPAAFADVVGNEARELFWGASLGEDARMDVLRAKAVGADTLLWERPLRFDVDFPNKPEVSSPNFGIADLAAEDLNRDGHPELYALANHRPYFPSLLLQLRPTDGTVQQRYLHPGHLRSGIEVVDVDDGPPPELLVGGHSNAFNDPVLAVLRPADLDGHAPTHGEYVAGSPEPAPHVAYLRFPSTALQKQCPTRYPMVFQIRPAPVIEAVEIVTQDGRSPDEGAGRPRVITTLGYDLRPRSVGTGGTYDRLADSLAQRGVLEAVPGPGDLREYGEEIQYWTGSGWSSGPTLVPVPEN